MPGHRYVKEFNEAEVGRAGGSKKRARAQGGGGGGGGA